MFIPRKLVPPVVNIPAKKSLLLGLLLMQIFPVCAAKNLEQMSLEELMNINVVGASKYEQKQQQVAAAVSVITRADIRTYGWRTLNQALASLPGIHTTYDYQYDADGNLIGITDGLQPGEHAIVSGATAVTDGEQVQIRQ